MNSPRFPESLVRRALAPFRVTVTPELASSIAAYGDLLLKWNDKVNLTAITDPREILTRHFGESLFAGQFIGDEPAFLVDVGSGAGFPGLALKLVRPGLRLLLLEPTKKRAAFLAEAARVLSLPRVKVETKRTADLAGHGLRADYITARAVGRLPELLDWAADAMRLGGELLLWLGARDADSAASRLEWRWDSPMLIPGAESSYLAKGMRR